VISVRDGEILLNPLFQYRDDQLQKVGNLNMRR